MIKYENLPELKVKVFADTADMASLVALAADPVVVGFTTNPSLMHQAGITDYRKFAREALQFTTGRPISFEVFADEPADMLAQAREIASWGPNIYVKIPVTNTKGDFMGPLLRDLVAAKVKVNVTAVMTTLQVNQIMQVLGHADAIISVFAGRIADTGRDPRLIFERARQFLTPSDKTKMLWASPRQVYDIIAASEVADIITVTPLLLTKARQLLGKSLEEYSLETVAMFYADAKLAGYQL